MFMTEKKEKRRKVILRETKSNYRRLKNLWQNYKELAEPWRFLSQRSNDEWTFHERCNNVETRHVPAGITLT